MPAKKSTIKPSDFRIGNYVKGSLIFDEQGNETGEQEIAIIVNIAPQGGYYWTDDLNADPATCGYNGGGLIEESDCIPLTIELLLQCGFQKQDDGAVYFLQVGNQLYLECDETLSGFYINPETWRGTFLEIWAQVKYLHQLQNLYHALTGKEFEMKNS